MNPRQDITPPTRRIITPLTRSEPDEQSPTSSEPLIAPTHGVTITPISAPAGQESETTLEQPSETLATDALPVLTSPSVDEPRPEPLAVEPTPLPATDPPASVGQASSAGGIVVGGPGDVSDDSTSPVSKPHKRRPRKKTVIILAVILVVVAIGAGLVFGVYLPNRPDAVYKTGFSRTGMALEGITDQATEDQTLQQFKRSKIESTLKVAGPEDITVDADFKTDFDDTSTDSSLTIKSDKTEIGPLDVQARLLTVMPNEGLYPDIYFRPSGFSALGLDAFLPDINQYDNKWIAITSKYLQSTIGSVAPEAASADKAKTPTSADISELSKAFFEVSNDYLFTGKDDKAIFKQESFIGKEEAGDQTLYHYRVSVNVDNTKAYCVALSDRVMSTKAYKNVTGDDDAAIKSDKEKAKKDCRDNDKYKDANDPIYDLWIDGKYKLIQKVRVTEREKKGNYFEFGQTYQGGDDLQFFGRFVNGEDDTDVALNLKSNLKQLTTSGTVKGATGKADNRYTFDGAFKASASKDDVKVTKPSDAVDIETIFEAFAGEDSMSIAPSGQTVRPSSSADNQFRSDISSLHTQLEGFFATHNYYPTLANINSSAWRASNMKSLRLDSLGPQEGQTTLARQATPRQYGYTAICSGNECTSYALSAILSDGTSLEKTSLE